MPRPLHSDLPSPFFTEHSVLISASAWPAWNTYIALSMDRQPASLGVPEAALPTEAHLAHHPAYLLGTSTGLTVEHKYTLALLELLASSLPQTLSRGAFIPSAAPPVACTA